MAIRFRDNRPAGKQLEIETARLRLRPLEESDAPAIFACFTPEVTRYMIPKSPAKIEETLEFLRSARAGAEQGTDFHWRIEDRDAGEFCGVCGLHEREDPDAPELGVWLRTEAHGQGLGREAITAVVRWAAAHIVCDGLIYPVDRRNLSSRKIPESLGGRLVDEKTVQNLSGFLLEEVVYRIPLAPPRKA